MNYNLVAKLKKYEHLDTDLSVIPRILELGTIPSLNDLISIQFNNEWSSFKNIEICYAVDKRLFFNLLDKERKWDAKILLKPVGEYRPYKRLFLDCKMSLGSNQSHDLIEWHKARMKDYEIEWEAAYCGMPNSESDFFFHDNHVYVFNNTLYDTVGKKRVIHVDKYGSINDLFMLTD